MSPAVAVAVITWVAIVVLYLGLAAVLREVRLLRAQVMRLSVVTAVQPDEATSSPAITMPGVIREGAPAVVLAADSSCPLCRMTIARLARISEHLPEPAVLLTYEDEQTWGPLPPSLRVVRDEAAWSQIAHLSPPVLLQVNGQGKVTDLVLPARDDDVDATLATWGVPTTPASKKVTNA